MSEHTKGPWRVEDGHVMAPVGPICFINGATIRNPGLRYQEAQAFDDADAAHIVRCVNAHDALVEALQRIAQPREPRAIRPGTIHPGEADAQDFQRIARAALALASGK